jgi:pimeloyl-ACP methyl ester carboxylesterase
MQDLILLHGAIGASNQLEALADNLKENFKIHKLDFSGHGGKAMPDENFSIPFFADEVKAYLQENKIGSANFFGYSMGGYVAIYLAKYSAGLVNKVITLATKFQWDEEIAACEVKMLDPEKISEKLPAFAAQLEARHHPNDWKMVMSKTAEMLLQLGKQNALQLNDYETISTECLLLVGDSDKMVSVDETMAVFDALPNARFKILPETPHPLEQVNESLLADLILSFINSTNENS